MMSPRDLRQVFFVIAISIICWTYIFPALNWPDEVYKLNRLPLDTHVYARIMTLIGPSECDVQTYPIGEAGFLSNTLRVGTDGPLGCYYVFKTINAALFLSLVLLGCFLLRNRQAQTSFFLAMIWPSIVFYSSSINQQTVFTVVSIFFVSRTLIANRVWPTLLFSVPLVLIDRSFIALTIFLSVLTLLKWRPRAAILMLFLAIVAIYVLRPYILGTSSAHLGLSAGVSVGDLSEQIKRYQDPIYISVALFAISFVYLGGTNSLLGIGVDYLFVFLFVLTSILKKSKNLELRVYLFALGVTYFLLIGIVPTLQTFRYYVFIMPAVIHFLVDNAARRRIYIGYSVSMSAIYLFIANALQV